MGGIDSLFSVLEEHLPHLSLILSYGDIIVIFLRVSILNIHIGGAQNP